MALTLKFIKEMLSQTYQVEPKKIRKKSKEINANNQVVRIFDIDSMDVVVISDPGDNEVIEFFLADEDMVEIMSEAFSEYVFAISPMKVGQALIAIVDKKEWEFGQLVDMPQEVFDLLPEYIHDLNGTFVNEIHCSPLTRQKDLIDDLKSLGFQYSNNLALFLNKVEGQAVFDLHFDASK